ncbi:XRE family transcriptional regulator [Actinomadura terrae]|uniref:XRE family transcriptional regulator n=1 Tax=Actinomadura terrae TaxID=604353 RepID=UPI001FA76207|nr:XRE family transcriptional regulator [Actinomadura terrae]
MVEEIDLRTPGGQSGVTPSMVSGWELDQHATSMGHRKTLCEIYQQPPEVLFAHQDQGLRKAAPKLLASVPELRRALMGTVQDARECLVVMGSRSRDLAYLKAIEEALDQRPTLVHYRVLFGPPFHQVLADHLIRLLDLRDPSDRTHGLKTLHIGLVEDRGRPERFLCASERRAVVPIPSLTSLEAFDSGISLGRAEACRLLDHGRQAYAAARRIETLQAVRALDVVGKRDATT